jgi:hypothetical protein
MAVCVCERILSLLAVCFAQIYKSNQIFQLKVIQKNRKKKYLWTSSHNFEILFLSPL